MKNFFCSVVFLIVLFSGFVFFNNPVSASSTFNQEDISNLTKPAIVKIAVQYKGVISIPDFDIDGNTLKLVIKQNASTTEIETQDTILGTGFVINDNGYILTNAHVVSENALKLENVSKIISFKTESLLKDQNEMKKLGQYFLSQNLKDVDVSDFIQKQIENMAFELVSKTKFTIAEKKITVLDPSFSGDKFSDLIEKGFKAQEIDVNNNYYKDYKDLAIIKIEEFSLPTINFVKDQTGALVGSKIYAYGFPPSADFSIQSYAEPTFFSGQINGLKDVPGREFKMIQTDSKISVDSIGSPIINENGEAIGIVANQNNSEVGQSFVFVLPISLAQEMIVKDKINLVESNYLKFFKSGLSFFKSNQCKNSIKQFNEALLSNKSFNISRYVEPYIKQCNNLISEGKSIDTPFDEFRKFLEDNKQLMPVAISVLAIFFSLIVIIFFIILSRKNPKNKSATKNIEEQIVQKEIVKEQDFKKTPEQKLFEYVQEARKFNDNDSQIAIELKRAGWSEDKIQEALKKK